MRTRSVMRGQGEVRVVTFFQRETGKAFEGETAPIFQTVIGLNIFWEDFLGEQFFTREWKLLKKSRSKCEKGNKSRSYLSAPQCVYVCMCIHRYTCVNRRLQIGKVDIYLIKPEPEKGQGSFGYRRCPLLHSLRLRAYSALHKSWERVDWADIHLTWVESLYSLKQQLSTRVNLPPRGHLAVSRDVFNCQDLEGRIVLLPSSEESPGMLLDILHCTAYSPTTKNYLPKCQQFRD